MTRFHKILIAIIITTLAGVAMAEFGRSDCVHWSSASQPAGWGYSNHVVHLENQCMRKTMRCDVSTDSNPQVQSIELRPKYKRTIIAAVGSRWLGFRTTVVCDEIY